MKISSYWNDYLANKPMFLSSKWKPLIMSNGIRPRNYVFDFWISFNW